MAHSYKCGVFGLVYIPVTLRAAVGARYAGCPLRFSVVYGILSATNTAARVRQGEAEQCFNGRLSAREPSRGRLQRR